VTPLRLLGRRVARGSEDCTGRFRPARLRECTREAEVSDPHDAVLVEEQVGGLDVAVQYAPGVRVFECRGDVAPDPCGLRDAESCPRVEHCPQASAFEQLEHHERHIVFPPVVDGDDVRMMQRRRKLRFSSEAAEERRVFGERGVQDFDRNPATQTRVVGDVDAAAGSGADRAVQQVTAGEHAAREVAHSAPGHAQTLVAASRLTGAPPICA
jgi:hypothetical protein